MLQASFAETILPENMGQYSDLPLHQTPMWTFEKIAHFFDQAHVEGRFNSNFHMLRRLSFLSYELDHFGEGLSSLQRVCNFIFDQNQFQVVEESKAGLSEALVPLALQSKRATPIVMGILLRTLGYKLGLRLDFIRCPGLFILKMRSNPESKFLDLLQRAKFMTSDEMLHTIQSLRLKCEISTQLSFEPLKEEEILLSYMNHLKDIAYRTKDDQLMVHSCSSVLNIEPKNLSVLRERSLAYYRLHQFPEALQDLKRYFSFTDVKHQPDELLRIYNELRSDHPV